MAFFSGGQWKEGNPPPLLLENFIPAMRVTYSRSPPHSARHDPAGPRPASDTACGRPWQTGKEMERLR